METAPRNCRFLSLVVVERVLKKESPGESLGESPRVLAEPPKRVKNESPGDSASQKSPAFDFRDSFLTRFGGSARTLGDSPSHETATFGCSNSTSWGPKAVTTVK